MLLQLFSRKLWRVLGLTLLAAVGVCGSAAPLRSVHAASDLFAIPAGTGIGSQSDPTDLVGALAAAAPGDTIYLGAGTYTGSGTAVVSLTTSINLLGGWDGAPTGPVVRDPAAFVSTLDGEDARQVLRITGGAAPTIDGLTITGGLADDGGGIYIAGSSPVVSNCVITGNKTQSHGLVVDGSGGGIYISGSSAAEIRQNQIISNESGWGAGIYRDGTQTSTIRENLISGNSASNDGGGIILSFADSDQILSNVFMNNTAGMLGGGLRVWGSDSIIRANRISGNSALQGAGMALGNASEPIIMNNFLFGNETDGMLVESSQPTVINNTLVGTGTVDAGVGVKLFSDTICSMPYCAGGAFLNNIVVGFSIGFARSGDGPTFETVDYNALWDNQIADYGTFIAVGNENIHQDPLFVHPAANDYHLQVASPCINAGTASPATPPPLDDFDGDPRPQMGVWDIGADEVWQRALPMVVR